MAQAGQPLEDRNGQEYPPYAGRKGTREDISLAELQQELARARNNIEPRAEQVAAPRWVEELPLGRAAGCHRPAGAAKECHSIGGECAAIRTASLTTK